MRKTFFFAVILIAFVACSNNQQTDNTQAENTTTKSDSIQSGKTKMEAFTSKTGTMLKFSDTNLPNLKSDYSSSGTRIRKIESKSDNAYFYQITEESRYKNNTASIEYSDLQEVIKAINVLKSDVSKDIEANSDYLENKFTTVDGFQLGYYVSSKGKATWFITLEKFGSDNTLFFNNVETIETAFTEAKNKIEELKK